MIMASETMKIAFVTGHVPLTEVKKFISTENIILKTKKLNASLIQDFGVRMPKIAVLGLNPHAGENGLLGREEEEYITPAVAKLRNENIMAFGPYPADSFFTNKNLENFDGILSMYHDQGLTAFKTLSFSDGVNFTAGLNIIRTSPVHGTAYEIAGQGKADEQSFRNAIFLESPPGPKEEILLLWVISANGLVWSPNWDNWLVPKKVLITVVTNLELIKSWGVIVSDSRRFILS